VKENDCASGSPVRARGIWALRAAGGAVLLLLVAGAVVAGVWAVKNRNSEADREEFPPETAAPEKDRVERQTPALEKDRIERLLPSPVTELAVGGDGRYLILHLPALKKLAVFDAIAARIVRYLPVEADKVHFVASMDKLLVVSDGKKVERWSLETFRREEAADLPFTAAVHSVALGSASNGPLVLGGPQMQGPGGLPLRFLDIATLQEVTFGTGEFRGAVSMVGRHPQYPHVMRMSADGRVLGMWNNSGLSPSGLMIVVLEGRNLRATYDHVGAGHIVPGPDGKVIYTAGGMYSSETTEPVDRNANFRFLGDRDSRPRFCLPAQQGAYYMATPVVDSRGQPALDRQEVLNLYVRGEERPLCRLPEIDPPEVESRRSALPLDKRIHLLPGAKLFVFIPATCDRLVLHRFVPRRW
jgi:hypothetical protein